MSQFAHFFPASPLGAQAQGGGVLRLVEYHKRDACALGEDVVVYYSNLHQDLSLNALPVATKESLVIARCTPAAQNDLPIFLLEFAAHAFRGLICKCQRAWL